MSADKFIVTPWHVEGDIDYDKLIEKFGTEKISPELLKKIKSMTRSYNEFISWHSTWLRLRFKKSFSIFVLLSQVFHDIEKKIITSLKENPIQTPETLEKSTQLLPDQIRRGIEWLKLKDLAIVDESKSSVLRLGKNDFFFNIMKYLWQ